MAFTGSSNTGHGSGGTGTNTNAIAKEPAKEAEKAVKPSTSTITSNTPSNTEITAITNYANAQLTDKVLSSTWIGAGTYNINGKYTTINSEEDYDNAVRDSYINYLIQNFNQSAKPFTYGPTKSTISNAEARLLLLQQEANGINQSINTELEPQYYNGSATLKSVDRLTRQLNAIESEVGILEKVLGAEGSRIVNQVNNKFDAERLERQEKELNGSKAKVKTKSPSISSGTIISPAATGFNQLPESIEAELKAGKIESWVNPNGQTYYAPNTIGNGNTIWVSGDGESGPISNTFGNHKISITTPQTTIIDKGKIIYKGASASIPAGLGFNQKGVLQLPNTSILNHANQLVLKSVPAGAIATSSVHANAVYISPSGVAQYYYIPKGTKLNNKENFEEAYTTAYTNTVLPTSKIQSSWIGAGTYNINGQITNYESESAYDAAVKSAYESSLLSNYGTNSKENFKYGPTQETTAKYYAQSQIPKIEKSYTGAGYYNTGLSTGPTHYSNKLAYAKAVADSIASAPAGTSISYGRSSYEGPGKYVFAYGPNKGATSFKTFSSAPTSQAITTQAENLLLGNNQEAPEGVEVVQAGNTGNNTSSVYIDSPQQYQEYSQGATGVAYLSTSHEAPSTHEIRVSALKDIANEVATIPTISPTKEVATNINPLNYNPLTPITQASETIKPLAYKTPAGVEGINQFANDLFIKPLTNAETNYTTLSQYEAPLSHDINTNWLTDLEAQGVPVAANSYSFSPLYINGVPITNSSKIVTPPLYINGKYMETANGEPVTSNFNDAYFELAKYGIAPHPLNSSEKLQDQALLNQQAAADRAIHSNFLNSTSQISKGISTGNYTRALPALNNLTSDQLKYIGTNVKYDLNGLLNYANDFRNNYNYPTVSNLGGIGDLVTNGLQYNLLNGMVQATPIGSAAVQVLENEPIIDVPGKGAEYILDVPGMKQALDSNNRTVGQDVELLSAIPMALGLGGALGVSLGSNPTTVLGGGAIGSVLTPAIKEGYDALTGHKAPTIEQLAKSANNGFATYAMMSALLDSSGLATSELLKVLPIGDLSDFSSSIQMLNDIIKAGGTPDLSVEEAESAERGLYELGMLRVDGITPTIIKLMLRVAPQDMVWGLISAAEGYANGEKSSAQLAQNFGLGVAIGTGIQLAPDVVSAAIKSPAARGVDDSEVLDLTRAPEYGEGGRLRYPYQVQTPYGDEDAYFYTGMNSGLVTPETQADLLNKASIYNVNPYDLAADEGQTTPINYEYTPTYSGNTNYYLTSHVTPSNDFIDAIRNGEGQVVAPENEPGDFIRKLTQADNGLYRADPDASGAMNSLNYAGLGNSGERDLTGLFPSLNSGNNFNMIVSMEPRDNYYSFQQFLSDYSPYFDKDYIMNNPTSQQALEAFHDYNLVGSQLENNGRALTLDSVRLALPGSSEAENIAPIGTRIQPVQEYPLIAKLPNQGIFSDTLLQNIIPTYVDGTEIFANYLPAAADLSAEDEEELNRIGGLSKASVGSPISEISADEELNEAPEAITSSPISEYSSGAESVGHYGTGGLGFPYYALSSVSSPNNPLTNPYSSYGLSGNPQQLSYLRSIPSSHLGSISPSYTLSSVPSTSLNSPTSYPSYIRGSVSPLSSSPYISIPSRISAQPSRRITSTIKPSRGFKPSTKLAEDYPLYKFPGTRRTPVAPFLLLNKPYFYTPQQGLIQSAPEDYTSLYSPSLLPVIMPQLESLAERDYSQEESLTGLRPLQAPTTNTRIFLKPNKAEPITTTTYNVPGVQNTGELPYIPSQGLTTTLGGNAFRNATATTQFNPIKDPNTLQRVYTSANPISLGSISSSAPTNSFTGVANSTLNTLNNSNLNNIQSRILANISIPATSSLNSLSIQPTVSPRTSLLINSLSNTSAPASSASSSSAKSYAAFGSAPTNMPTIGGVSLVPSSAQIMAALGPEQTLMLLNHIDPTRFPVNAIQNNEKGALAEALNNLSYNNIMMLMDEMTPDERINVYGMMGIPMGEAIVLAEQGQNGLFLPTLSNALSNLRKKLTLPALPQLIKKPNPPVLSNPSPTPIPIHLNTLPANNLIAV